MGLRLPLDSLPWSDADDLLTIEELDPFAPRAPLAVAGQRDDSQSPVSGPEFTVSTSRRSNHVSAPAAHRRPKARSRVCHRAANRPPASFVRRCASSRAAACCTSSCRRSGSWRTTSTSSPQSKPRRERWACAFCSKGIRHPATRGCSHFSVTPDPGVIEVNVQPVSDWDGLVEQTTTLYEDARHAGLSPEKFMLDGRHTGTGGGNHFVLGGSTPADSPFLRRQTCCEASITYWHNHPSLSYLFSGLFLGPTSQAPRIDEGRHDSLYEIEIAFSRFAPPDSQTPPWFVDRALRHLLVDVTGNTHRAEFCIDKLYSPDLSSGRRGLLEMRAFEMPPDARMSVAQQLLLRALIARFWREPYTAGLTRWGTELHDRFMLPYFIALDFDDVIEELRRAGYDLSSDWFAPHLEFRFPLAGELSARAIHLTLRQALEPWHVLGEEGAAGGTARFVDSSLERMQLLVSGVTGDRFVITCNGRPLPLQPTGRNGEYVAGVRYRAWQPPSALHPTIPVHTPLTFDIVDTWMERSVAGCQYHVMHPGGRNYDLFPVNSYEAESRRLARFTRLAHTPGRVRAGHPERSMEFPYTLDLRTQL